MTYVEESNNIIFVLILFKTLKKIEWITFKTNFYIKSLTCPHTLSLFNQMPIWDRLFGKQTSL